MTAAELADKKIFELESKLDSTRLKIEDLATMGTLITSIPDTDTVLSVVMEMAIRMVDGEVGLIQLFEEEILRTKVTWGVDDSLIKGIVYADDQDISTYCYLKQESVLFNGIGQKLKLGPSIVNAIAVPIKSRARCHGTVVIINKTSGDNFGEEDQKILEMLINFAAVAIDNSILREESLEKQKFEQELAIARQVQETILPQGVIEFDRADIGSFYEPAREVGGDFYDVIRVSENEFWMIIGDVSNKGVPAAMVMSATMAIIKSELYRDGEISPAELMQRLNEVLCKDVIRSQGMFVTLFMARFNLENKRLIYCNAGHVQPLYWDIRRSQVEELKTGGTFVGQFPGVTYKAGEREITPGDRLFAFTDGLTEAEDIHQGFFGVERAMQIFLAEKELPAGEFCRRVKEWADRFREGAREDTIDDFTLFFVKIK